MTTYATMRTAIIDELGNDGDLSASHVNSAIKRAIKHYERRPWWFNQKTATFSTVNGQEYYGASDLADIPNIIQIDSAMVNIGGTKQKLRPHDFQSVDEDQTGYVVYPPHSYTIRNSEIRLYPIPDGAYTVTLSYIYRLDELSADSDSNAWTTFCEEMIRQSAKRRLALDILHAEEVANRCAGFEAEAYSELLAENRRRLPKAPLRTDAILAPQAFDIVNGL